MKWREVAERVELAQRVEVGRARCPGGARRARRRSAARPTRRGGRGSRPWAGRRRRRRTATGRGRHAASLPHRRRSGRSGRRPGGEPLAEGHPHGASRAGTSGVSLRTPREVRGRNGRGPAKYEFAGPRFRAVRDAPALTVGPWSPAPSRAVRRIAPPAWISVSVRSRLRVAPSAWSSSIPGDPSCRKGFAADFPVLAASGGLPRPINPGSSPGWSPGQTSAGGDSLRRPATRAIRSSR